MNHESENNHRSYVTGAGSPRVALPIVAVTVKGEESGTSVNTFALLDSGSTSTFCSDKLLQQLGVHGRKEILNLTTLEKKTAKLKLGW